jgi:hypothetical protein
MMREAWLKTNRRVLLVGMIPPILLVGVGLIPVAVMTGADAWLQCGGWAAVGAGVSLIALVAIQMRLPRLAYCDGQLLVYLAGGGPLRVPIEMVQCFFMGTGAGQIPGSRGSRIGVRNLTMRLDEKATEYHHREVKPALGRWDEGYIVIHGAWCEPLNLSLVQLLNTRLASVKANLSGNAIQQAKA